METIRGYVWSIVHKSEDFYIFSVELSGKESYSYGRKITCKGQLFGVQGLSVGVPLSLSGTWVFHPKFGRQFEILGWAPWSDSSAGVEAFLTTCLGLSALEEVSVIVDTFGTDTFEVLDKHPERLRVLPIFSEEGSLEALLESWAYAKASSELSAFFADHDVTASQMKALFDTFGAQAKAIIEENPYRLLEVEGFHFTKADEVAQRMGLDQDDPRRFEGAVLWVLRASASSGHLFVRRGHLAQELRELVRQAEGIDFDEPDLPKALLEAVTRLEARQAVMVDPDAGVYLTPLFYYERESSKLLAGFVAPSNIDIDFEEFIASYQSTYQIELSTAQKDAVEKLMSNRVLVLTGLPGTGKTTVIKTLVSLLQRANVSIALMAPTGIASKRLASVTGQPAATIHRMLRYDGNQWAFNRQNKYPIGAVIVDEMSMVDQELFFRIVDALEEGTTLVLVGDDAQLPSVGPGSVLRELIRCSAIPTVRLTQIFRQAEESNIIRNSHRINRGDSIEPGDDTSDFRFIHIADPPKIASLIVQMALKLKARDANFQVLSPKYDGDVGVTNLNDLLREALNPPGDGKREYAVGTFKFREGDRVMVVKNDYQLGVYNGDMGKLMAIHREHFVVRIHGAGEDGLDMLVNIERKDIPRMLRLAYAITVHKSQGSEFDTVILPMVKAHGRMLQRNLFYTAVTRAKQKVWLLGESSAVSRAIENDKVVFRNTAFERAIVRSVEDLTVKRATPPPVEASQVT